MRSYQISFCRIFFTLITKRHANRAFRKRPAEYIPFTDTTLFATKLQNEIM